MTTSTSTIGYLICNGIAIASSESRGYNRRPFGETSTLFDLKVPQISVFDNEGNLPVNLQRTQVHSLPFEEALRQEVIKDMIAYILVTGPSDSVQRVPPAYPLVGRQVNGFPVPWLIYSQYGFVLADRWLAVNLNYERIVSTTAEEPGLRREIETYSLPKTLFAYPEVVEGAYKTWLEQSLETLRYRSYINDEPKFFTGARVLISKTRYVEFQTPRKYRKDLRKQFQGFKDTNGWVLLNTGQVLRKSFDFNHLAAKLPKNPSAAIAELYLDGKEWSKKAPSEMGSIWLDVVGNTVIPFDINERQRLLSNSFKKLDKYVQKHLKAVEKKVSNHLDNLR